MGRPDMSRILHKKITSKQMDKLVEAYREYIDETPDPIIAEFVSSNFTALEYEVTKDNMHDWPEVVKLNRTLTAKQEAYLLRKGMNSQSAAMSIFRLKQPSLGYRDRFEQDVTSKGEPIKFVNTVPRSDPKGKDKK